MPRPEPPIKLHNVLVVDFETYSELDLKQVGVYVYAAHPSTEILCCAFGLEHYVDPSQIEVWTPDKPFPAWVLRHVREGKMLGAHNAGFERIVWNQILTKYGVPTTPINQWTCTAAQVAALAGPRSLGDIGTFFSLSEVKDTVGGRILSKASKPDKKGVRAVLTTPEREQLLSYNKQDVVAEIAVKRFARPLQRSERLVWLYDQVINDRGIYVDLDFARAAKKLWDAYLPKVNARCKAVCGYDATQVKAVTEWVASRGVVGVHSLQKELIKPLLVTGDLPEDVHQVLSLRLEAGSTAVKKFSAFLKCANADSRVRGSLVYHGASTGRMAGRLIQPQNMKRGGIPGKEIKLAMDLVRQLNIEAIEILFGSVGETLGSLCRPTIQAPKGMKLIASDFSQIEARCVAWIAGQTDLLRVFADPNGKVYEFMASKVFNKPLHQITKDSQERFIGKTLVLGCFGLETKVQTKRGWVRIIDVENSDLLWDGLEWVSHQGVLYRGLKTTLRKRGVNATPDHLCLLNGEWQTWESLPGHAVEHEPKSVFDIVECGPRSRFTILTDQGPLVVHNCGYQMGGDNFHRTLVIRENIDIGIDNAKAYVKAYRDSNPAIVRCWYALERAVCQVIETGKAANFGPLGIRLVGDWLFITLPSGRDLAYYKPRLIPGKYGNQMQFFGVDNNTGRRILENTYGGKLLENVCSGICRDLMVAATDRLEKAGYQVVLSVHDEVLTEVPEDFGSPEEMSQIMQDSPSWARGFPVATESWQNKFYRK